MKQQTIAHPVYPPRVSVGNPDDWDDTSYAPHEFFAGVLLTNPPPVWADPTDFCDKEAVGAYLCYMDGKGDGKTTVAAKCTFDARGRPRNPKGKTGLCGRGLLGRWGPNHAADVIVTRVNGEGKTQVLLVTKHVGDMQSPLAFPAGMVEPGSDVPETLRAELTQEAVKESTAVERLFKECRVGVVYRGHVDDARNTDNAWMETTAVHFHATEEIAAELQLGVVDTGEIKGVAWYDIDAPTAMYASHLSWLENVRKSRADLEASVTSNKRKRAADGDDGLPVYVS